MRDDGAGCSHVAVDRRVAANLQTAGRQASAGQVEVALRDDIAGSRDHAVDGGGFSIDVDAPGHIKRFQGDGIRQIGKIRDDAVGDQKFIDRHRAGAIADITDQAAVDRFSAGVDNINQVRITGVVPNRNRVRGIGIDVPDDQGAIGNQDHGVLRHRRDRVRPGREIQGGWVGNSAERV